jgi:hypothetical protein
MMERSTGLFTPGESGKFSYRNLMRLRKKELLELFPTISVENYEKVYEGFVCILEIYFLYGILRRPYENETNLTFLQLRYNCRIIKSFTNSLARMLQYLEDFGELEWVSYFKYKLCAFYSYYECEGKDPVPVIKGIGQDLPNVIFGGLVLKSQRNYQRSNPSEFASFILTMNVAKMGMPRPGDDYIQKKVAESTVHLTTKPKALLPDINLGAGFGGDFVLSKQSLISELKRTVREVFRNADYNKKVHYEPFFPSTSACQPNKMANGGVYLSVWNSLIRNDPEFESFGKAVIETDVIDVTLSSQFTRQYGENGKIEQEIMDEADEEKPAKAVLYNDEPLRLKWNSFMDKMKFKAFDERPLVRSVGLAEALKCRTISKGPPLLYSFLKPLQKFMWSTLKRNSVFGLIGQPIDVVHVRNAFNIIDPDEIMINGDYKASTDNLHSWVSEALAEELIEVLRENETDFHIDDDHKAMLLRSLTGHIFQIPKGKDKRGNIIYEEKLQREGQLMGSVTSFPFLCLANACFCRLALELAHLKQLRIVDEDYNNCPLARLLVNGDDCTMKGPREPLHSRTLDLKTLWLVITRYGGLESSVGKTLFSLPNKPICVINSRTFDFVDGNWHLRKFVNMGLMLGKKRSVASGECGDKVLYERLGAIHHELLETSPGFLIPDVNKRFLYYNSDVLKAYPNIPWTAPNFLGGPGLKRVQDCCMSERDRKLASILIMNQQKSGDLIKGLHVERPQNFIEWKTHSIINDRFKQIGVEEENFGWIDVETPSGSSIESSSEDPQEFKMEQLQDHNYFEMDLGYSKLYSLFAVEVLFTHRPHLVKILNDDMGDARDENRIEIAQEYSDRRRKKVLSDNNIAWARAQMYASGDREEFADVVVRSVTDLEHEKKKFVIPVVNLDKLPDGVDVHPRKLNLS